jgi:hypothetical protein
MLRVAAKASFDFSRTAMNRLTQPLFTALETGVTQRASSHGATSELSTIYTQNPVTQRALRSERRTRSCAGVSRHEQSVNIESGFSGG